MGDPKFPRRSFDAPSHPWRGERIKAETETCKLYGLKNKRELWKAQAVLRNLRTQSKNLQARVRLNDEQAELERDLLLKKLGRLGLLPMEGSTLDDVLGLTPEAVLNRRLQTLVQRKGLATTLKQARQFIVHGHVTIDGHKVTIPGYLVKRGEEDKIAFNPHSPISNELHPLRAGPQLESGPAAPAPRPEKTPNSEKVEKVIKSIEGDEAEDIADLPEIQEE
ncbi:30S ribosomal protein S4 [Methanomassiliicoccales archaeon RumEn M1]|jgi:small subunit ribosomal protein S4|nr:30S ribosomal protein S4 [Methanomassiliicoccales archaeon RumEn M1]